MFKKVFLSSTIIFATAFLIINYSTSFSTIVRPSLKAHFITSSSKAAQARKRSNNVKPGERIHFYYKIGPLRCIAGKGAPFKTRLIVQRSGKTLKDFGWQNANAASKKQMKKNLMLSWYHNCAWNFSFGKNSKPGSYNAIISHEDLNSKKTITIRYMMNLVGSSKMDNSHSTSDSGDRPLQELNKYNSVEGFYIGMSMDEAKSLLRKRAIKTGILNMSKAKESDYVWTTAAKESPLIMKGQGSYTGKNTPTLYFSLPDGKCRIIKEIINVGSHSNNTVAVKTQKMLNKMNQKYGKNTKFIKGYYGGYIWVKDNYRLVMHYLNLSGFAAFHIYHTDTSSTKKIPFVDRYYNNLSKYF